MYAKMATEAQLVEKKDRSLFQPLQQHPLNFPSYDNHPSKLLIMTVTCPIFQFLMNNPPTVKFTYVVKLGWYMMKIPLPFSSSLNLFCSFKYCICVQFETSSILFVHLYFFSNFILNKIFIPNFYWLEKNIL